jgi:hypothetical protein
MRGDRLVVVLFLPFTDAFSLLVLRFDERFPFGTELFRIGSQM